jgi:glycosyltransferase involved in cell wall biosynthesis
VYVHDLTPVRFPELCLPASLKYPPLVARAIAGGAWVQTGTQAMAGEIVDYFGIEPHRVAVIPPGIKVPGPPRPTPARRPYILAVGTTEPRKDFPGLIAAFDAVAASVPDVELKVAGPQGWAEEAVRAAMAAARYSGRIHRLGWVPDLTGLVANAAVFAYPSLYEGFGFPPLEAMALGVPVVATATPAALEVLGDAAALVPVGDRDALAERLLQLLGGGAGREQLIEKGRRRAVEYTWTRAGDALMDLYRRLTESREASRRGR